MSISRARRPCAHIEQQIDHIGIVPDDRAVFLKRALIAGEGFFAPTKRFQRQAAPVPCPGVMLIERQRLIIGRQRIGVAVDAAVRLPELRPAFG